MDHCAACGDPLPIYRYVMVDGWAYLCGDCFNERDAVGLLAAARAQRDWDREHWAFGIPAGILDPK